MTRAVALLSASLFASCAATRPLAVPTLEPSPIAAADVADPFLRDHAPGGLSEDDLRRLLSAPVELEEHARVGVVPVRGAYDADREAPVAPVTGALTEALTDTGRFEFVTEVSTDWPATSSIAGLRELAARNRCDYLLLYRHRFVERSWLNPWAWTWLTGVGIVASPAATREAAGILEATLFDVKSGTLLFTVFERAQAEKWTSPFYGEVHDRELRESLVNSAAKPLAARVVEGVQRLVAARVPPDPEAKPEPLADAR